MEDRMTTRSNSLPRALSFVALFALGSAGCAAELEDAEALVAAQAGALSACSARSVPDILAVPDGNRLAFKLDAIGVQMYRCQATASGGYGWVFVAPEADLLRKHGKIAGSHYAGPTWEALDGSTVVAARLTSYVADPSAIPWLLLEATSHTGKGRMSDVTFIQRLDTVAGLAPASGCDAEHVGEPADVHYTASYYFYEAKH
jgi:hypothetical protein